MTVSIIGQPYYWQNRRGQWQCNYRGHTLPVPGPDVSLPKLKQLADRAEQAMLRQNLERARKRAN